MDLICPIYWLDENWFEKNLDSWFSELNLNEVLIGNNNPKHDKFLNEIQEKHDNIRIIDQTKHNTLGYCLKELMENVSTEWFVYLHSDVFIPSHVFEMMKYYIQEKNGIIESDRLHWDGTKINVNGLKIPKLTYENYYFRERAFSGFQIFQKKAIETILPKIEDDYIYRNEDLIFQAECLKNGFNYVKAFAFHIHQLFNWQWTRPKKEAYLMQIKGLIKYTNPNHITVNICTNVFRFIRSKYDISLNHFLHFCNENNPKWTNYIKEIWEKLNNDQKEPFNEMDW
ncbi:MAG: glycosyltransferase [Promethearchaeota archaeon]